jgi:hypothetical protein
LPFIVELIKAFATQGNLTTAVDKVSQSITLFDENNLIDCSILFRLLLQKKLKRNARQTKNASECDLLYFLFVFPSFFFS